MSPLVYLFFSIPANYRPTDNSYAMCAVNAANNVVLVGQASVGTDGAIRQSLTSTCRGIVGFAEYNI